jgi:hypothetical protein
MASGDTPKRRAEPLAATDSATDVDESTDPRVRRPTELMDATRERRERQRAADDNDDAPAFESTVISPAPEDKRPRRSAQAARPAKRRDDATAWPDEMPAQKPRARDPRATEIFMDNPDVVGAPERTVIAPLPPQEAAVDPAPMPRVATRSDDDRDSGHTRRSEVRSRDEVRARDSGRARDEGRDRDERRTRDDGRSRNRDTDGRARSRDRESHDERSHSKRDPARAKRAARDEPNQALVHQKTQIERTGDESAWLRLRVALRDVWVTSVLAVKHHWHVLRTQGPRPYIDAARPYARRAWLFMRHWAVKAKIVAVKSAVRVGLVKPRRLEYELESSDKVDRARADAWRRFHDGRKSSSYLQDDE